MSRPITNGGFSNEGAQVLQRKIDNEDTFTTTFTTTYKVASLFDISYASPSQSSPDTSCSIIISTQLAQSQLTLSAFYLLDQVSQFITTHNLTKVALQSPNSLLSDAPLIISMLKQKYNHASTSFYVLGDTNYGECCVDVVAAQHIKADGIIHLGHACMSQTESIPVFYCFGRIPLLTSSCGIHDGDARQSTQTMALSQHPRLLSSILQLMSIPVGDGDDQNASDAPTKHTAVLFDRRFTSDIHLIVSVCQQLGVAVIDPLAVSSPTLIGSAYTTDPTTTPIISWVISDELQSILDNLPSNSLYKRSQQHQQHQQQQQSSALDTSTAPTISIAYSASQPLTGSTHLTRLVALPAQHEDGGESGHGQSHHLELTFSGYTFLTPSLSKLNTDFDINGFQDMPTKEIWDTYFNPSQWNIAFISATCQKHNETPADSPTNDRVDGDVPHSCSIQHNNSIPTLDQLVYDTASGAYLTYLGLNFPQHYIYAVYVPPMSTPDKLLPADVSITEDIDEQQQQQQQLVVNWATYQCNPILFSPNATTARTLARRYYLIEKAKNCETIGIVAGTLASDSTVESLNRIKTILDDNCIKHYTLLIGKVNPAKLLNFLDIQLFVVLACPLSVFILDHNTLSHVDMILPFECELAFNYDEYSWDGSYTTDYNDVMVTSGRLSVKTGSIAVEQSHATKSDDMNQLPSSTPGGTNEVATQQTKGSNEPSADNDNVNNTTAGGDDGKNVLRDDGDDNDDNHDEDDESEQHTGVRWSAIDNRYHQIRRKPKQQQQPSDEHGETSNYQVVQQTFGVVEAGVGQMIYVSGQKKTREFTGLDQHYEITDENMVIHSGLHGTSQGYVSVSEKDNGKDSIQKK